jgi:CelD/BcsL family acetyltransferase involved in cellulose biosynthesis
MTMPGAAAQEDNRPNEHWVELPERFSFTFAGVFLGAVSFRCLILQRPLGEPPYPLEPSLFEQLPDDVRGLHICSQPISAKQPRVSRLGRGIRYVPLQGRRFFIDLNGSFEAYLGKFRERSRHYMKRNVRRFARSCGGSVLWREFRDATDMAEFHSLASEVSRKTYQHRLLRSGIDTSSSFREEMVRGAVAGHVRGYILFRQQTPIAYMFCQARGSDLVFEKTGFDPSLAAHSPGFVLLWFALQRLFADREFRRFDFGEGEYPHKEHMATDSVDVAEIYCFPWNFRNVALVVMHSAVVTAAHLLTSTLNILGIGQRLKKMIRHRTPRALRT